MGVSCCVGLVRSSDAVLELRMVRRLRMEESCSCRGWWAWLAGNCGHDTVVVVLSWTYEAPPSPEEDGEVRGKLEAPS